VRRVIGSLLRTEVPQAQHQGGEATFIERFLHTALRAPEEVIVSSTLCE